MLEGVLGPEGTASEAAVPGYKISGKTGTAQKAENGGYSETKYVSSFIGFAPSNKARLLIAVVQLRTIGDAAEDPFDVVRCDETVGRQRDPVGGHRPHHVRRDDDHERQCG